MPPRKVTPLLPALAAASDVPLFDCTVPVTAQPTRRRPSPEQRRPARRSWRPARHRTRGDAAVYRDRAGHPNPAAGRVTDHRRTAGRHGRKVESAEDVPTGRPGPERSGTWQRAGWTGSTRAAGAPGRRGSAVFSLTPASRVAAAAKRAVRRAVHRPDRDRRDHRARSRQPDLPAQQHPSPQQASPDPPGFHPPPQATRRSVLGDAAQLAEAASPAAALLF